MTDEPQPRRGALAICSRGCLGLITSQSPERIDYPDGGEGIAWTGVHLLPCAWEGGPPNAGAPWSSRTPRVVGHIDEFGDLFRELVAARPHV